MVGAYSLTHSSLSSTPAARASVQLGQKHPPWGAKRSASNLHLWGAPEAGNETVDPVDPVDPVGVP